MSVDLKNSETLKNLMRAFAGESQARNRYTFAASVCRQQKLHVVEAVFRFTADQEKEHAERFFKFLEGGDLEITASFPAGVIGDTRANLIEAAAGEHDEWYNLYPAFAAKAREEGFPAIAYVWEHVVVAEKQHEHRYLGLLANVENGTVFKKDHPVVWRCRNCGYLHEGTEAPETCPACAHPRAYFEILAENW